MADPITTADRWRVDVGGVSVNVYNKEACEHLQRVNHRLAVMKMALHRISKMHPSGPGAGNVARGALEEAND